MEEQVKQLFSHILPIAVGAIAFFLGRFIKKSDKDSEELSKFSTDIEVIKTQLVAIRTDIDRFDEYIKSFHTIREEWAGIKLEISRMVSEVQRFKEAQEDLVILKRDQKTIWKTIDTLREQATRCEEGTKILRERSHFFNNKLTVIRLMAEQQGWQFKDDWKFPSSD